MSTRTYPAKIVRWIDGDTVVLDIDLGLRQYTVAACRLAGVNTPEKGQQGWGEATLFANTAAPAGATVTALTHKPDPSDKYGRWLVDLVVAGMHLNAELLRQGLALPYPSK